MTSLASGSFASFPQWEARGTWHRQADRTRTDNNYLHDVRCIGTRRPEGGLTQSCMSFQILRGMSTKQPFIYFLEVSKGDVLSLEEGKDASLELSSLAGDLGEARKGWKCQDHQEICR
eukprot:scaffold320826_cov53-Attheya_sp.AAC.3